jgi:chromosome segregation ATPase
MSTNDERLDRVEDHMIDMRLAVSALLETVTQHQRNFETIQRNFETLTTEMREMRSDMQEMRSDMRDFQSQMHTMQSEIRGLQTENNRILEILERRLGD